MSIKDIWMKFWMKNVLYGDKYGRFEKAYKVQNPWKMDSHVEQYRFEQLNRIIDDEIGGVENLLEVGCGEGHHTEYLHKVCNNLYGFDVSQLAVKRALERCPRATLTENDLFSYEPPAGIQKFDLAIACEVLYYIKDVPAALKKLEDLAHNCLLSYYRAGMHSLDEYIDNIPQMNRQIIEFGEKKWDIIWWKAR